MRWLVRGFWPSIGALLSAAALVVVGQVGVTGVASATTEPAPVAALSAAAPWSSLEQQAFQALPGIMGTGALEGPTAVGPVETGTASTPQGPVSVVERTIVTSDGAGQLVLSLAWLGGTQLVVTALVPAAGFSGVTLVLAPGTAQVSGVYPLGPVVATTTADVGGSSAASISDALGHARSVARLAGYLGCSPYPQPPNVIGSIYGPLINAVGVTSCPNPATLAIIAGLDEWGTEIGTGGGSTFGSYLSVNVFHACYVQATQNQFTTVQLWSVDGVLTGATSAASYLGCA